VATKKAGKTLIVSIAKGFVCFDVTEGAEKSAPKKGMERKIKPNNCISFGPNKVTESRLISTDNPCFREGCFLNKRCKFFDRASSPVREPIEII